LVSSGLIDSLALVEIIVKLENISQMRIPAGKVQPKDMNNRSFDVCDGAAGGKTTKMSALPTIHSHR
jgi:hypothetical protein